MSIVELLIYGACRELWRRNMHGEKFPSKTLAMASYRIVLLGET